MMENIDEQRNKEQLLLDNYYLFNYTTKSELEFANEKVAGKVLTNLYKTIGSEDQLNRTTNYFELLLDIDGQDKYRFTESYLTKLAKNEKFEMITNQNLDMEEGIVFKNQIIREISQSQYGEWTLELANGIIIEVRNKNGVVIFIGKKYW